MKLSTEGKAESGRGGGGGEKGASDLRKLVAARERVILRSANSNKRCKNSFGSLGAPDNETPYNPYRKINKF